MPPRAGKKEGLRLLFPPTVSARQRAALHQLGDVHNVPHASTGDGAQRRLELGPADAARSIDLGDEMGEDSPSDQQLCAAIEKHLSIDASPIFDALAAPPIKGRVRKDGANSNNSATQPPKSLVGVEEFCARVSRLQL